MTWFIWTLTWFLGKSDLDLQFDFLKLRSLTWNSNLEVKQVRLGSPTMKAGKSSLFFSKSDLLAWLLQHGFLEVRLGSPRTARKKKSILRCRKFFFFILWQKQASIESQTQVWWDSRANSVQDAVVFVKLLSDQSIRRLQTGRRHVTEH